MYLTGARKPNPLLCHPSKHGSLVQVAKILIQADVHGRCWQGEESMSFLLEKAVHPT